MKEDNRATLTGALWFFEALVLIALFISAAAQGELTQGHILIAFVLLGLAVMATVFLLRWNSDSDEQAKAKRQRIDSLLGNLSDEDLLELKHRLADMEDREVSLAETLGDDGELVLRD